MFSTVKKTTKHLRLQANSHLPENRIRNFMSNTIFQEKSEIYFEIMSSAENFTQHAKH